MGIFITDKMQVLEGKDTMKTKTKTRKLSIKAKILSLSSIIIVLLSLLLGISSYVQLEEEMMSMGIEQAGTVATIAASQIDGDILKGLQPGEEETEGYQSELAKMQLLKEECSVAFLYTLTTDGQKVYYGIDTDTSANKCEIGKEFDYDYEELKSVFEGEAFVQDFIDITEDGELLSVYMPIRDSAGDVVSILGSDYDASGIVERLTAARNQIVVMVAVGLVAALFILNIVVSGIMRNIRRVNDKIYELVHNEGDLTQTLMVRTGDEMELMADNVNELLQYIRSIMLNISEDSVKLNDSTRAVVDALTTAGGNIMDVSATMEEMSAAMEETTASLNQVDGSVTEIYDRINDVSEQAQTGSDSTDEIQVRAKGIYNEAARQQTDAQTLVQEIAHSLNEKIEKSKSVEEINLLTQNIISITQQTNLLSLNASIEAARAGEAGRGFAVVAGEIGKLATDSADAAEKIRKVSEEVITSVEGLAVEAENMVRFMEETAMEGYRRLLETSKDYSSDAEKIHGMMRNFAEDSRKLQTAMDGIRDSVKAINIAVEESAKGIVSTAETTTELTQNVNAIEGRAGENKRIAQCLEEEVGKFKLE